MCGVIWIAIYRSWTVFHLVNFELKWPGSDIAFLKFSFCSNTCFLVFCFFLNRVTQTGCLARPVGQISGRRTVSLDGVASATTSWDDVTSATTGLGSRSGSGGGCLASPSSSGSCLPTPGQRQQYRLSTLHQDETHFRPPAPAFSPLAVPTCCFLSRAQLGSSGGWLCKAGGEGFFLSPSLLSQERKHFWSCLGIGFP